MQNRANGEMQYEIIDLLRLLGIPASLDCSTMASVNESNSRLSNHDDFNVSEVFATCAGSTTETEERAAAVVIKKEQINLFENREKTTHIFTLLINAKRVGEEPLTYI
ncbi:hypothetical protein OGAPHI_002463 [Ogataea philodendri]|uniref:Uncharacterized protein n=1 Tax=Ogataea philodendri TaxID=1378263 RepID=A0A9P8PC13_9ASCO|nr:uncharacterized protein OGAPHI_002463 [Ogataea philodendri]KAH3668709.1 hypothetical protein OGAPHI_002463 [Ogataea philodendri]